MQDIGSKYSFEVKNKTGLLLAEFSGRANGRELRFTRNGSYQVSWTLDLDNLEQYSRQIDIHPESLLDIGRNEVYVKRHGLPLFGGQLLYREGNLSDKKELAIRAVGWLDLFKDRYTGPDREFPPTDQSQIAWTVIDESQTLTNGDFGITEGNLPASVNRSRTYENKNIKELLMDLSSVENGFDFEFTWDKQFNTFPNGMGTERSEFELTYPGNIKSLKITEDGSQLVNYALARGQGFGTGQIIDVLQDVDAQAIYQLRQRILDYSEIPDVETLDEIANEEISQFKYPLKVIDLTIDGNQDPHIGAYWLGDRVKVKVNGLRIYEDINSFFRVDEIGIKIDEDDNEEIQLKLTSV